MVSIRFRRVGRRGARLFRLGVIPSQRGSSTPLVEVLAAYNPAAADGSKITNLKKDRLDHWLKTGAQLSVAATRLLRKENILPAVPASSK